MWQEQYELLRSGAKCLKDEGWDTFSWKLRSYFKCRRADRGSYQSWIKSYEPDKAGLELLRSKSEEFIYKPKISLVMPVWNSDRRWLSAAIESVLNQAYDNWELCICEGGSTLPHVREVLDSYANKNKKIKLNYIDFNKGISGNLNEALSSATGDFVGFLDHDDELAPFALHEVASILNENRTIKFIYSDEDKINDKGIRSTPHFKPDWSPDLFLSCNYLCHFSVIERALVDEARGFREEFDGSQDYDLFLRILERIEAYEIAHIPKILYHWRITSTSSALSSEAKPYASIAAKKALRDAMARRGIGISDVIDGLYPGIYRIKYEIEGHPKVSIVIPWEGDINILDNCINSILTNTNYDNFEIFIVSDQGREEMDATYHHGIKEHSKIRVLGHSGLSTRAEILNYAISKINNEYILILDEHLEVTNADWLSSMLEHIQRDDVGAVGAKLYRPDKRVEHAGIVFGADGTPLHFHRGYPKSDHGYFGRLQMVQNFSAVSGSCMMTRKRLFDEVGEFDHANFGQLLYDIDFCLKLKDNGYIVLYTPYAELLYYKSSLTRNKRPNDPTGGYSNEVSHMIEKWNRILKMDPSFSPNLKIDNDLCIRFNQL